jgi:hypothetical protein
VIKGNFAGPLDLNCDKKLQADLSFDLNGDTVIGKLPETRNDWASLTLAGGPTGLIGDAPIFSVQRVLADFEKTEPCATASDARAALDAQPTEEVPVVDPSSPTPSPENPTVPTDDGPQLPSSPTDDSPQPPPAPTDNSPQNPPASIDDVNPQTPAEPPVDVDGENPTDLTEESLGLFIGRRTRA